MATMSTPAAAAKSRKTWERSASSPRRAKTAVVQSR
jgi:hypothetical protein